MYVVAYSTLDNLSYILILCLFLHSLWPDDRFILKQMNRYEVQSFAKFAPHYFQYVTTAHTEQVSYHGYCTSETLLINIM